MAVSRRRFVQVGSMFGLVTLFTKDIALGQQAGAPLKTGVGYAIPKEVYSDPLFYMTRQDFAAHLKTAFKVSLGRVQLVTMTLVATEDHNPSFVNTKGTSNRECFALTFSGPSSLPLGQNTYTMEHQQIGRFQLLIVPGTKQGAPSILYTAIINRVSP